MLILGLIALANTLFNVSLCLFFREQKFTLVNIPLAALFIGFYSLHFLSDPKPWLLNLCGLLSLIILCLASGSHEYDFQVLLYQNNFKAALYLMLGGMSGHFVYHVGVALAVPLTLQIAFLKYDPIERVHLPAEVRGYEEYLVFVRQFMLTGMLATVYYANLRMCKIQFIRRCLHEMNEKSIGDVLDQVSEPILIVKRKHNISMKPKYINRAAKELL